MAHDPILWLTLTIGAYAAGVALQRLCGRHPALNPTLIAIAIVATALLLLHADYPSYFVAAQPIHLLLGPAVVALAVPLYRHITLVCERAALLVAALLVGSITAIVSSVIAGWFLGLPRADLLSLAPKSATAAVSMAVAGKIGGIPAVTAVLTILTGISGAVVAPFLLNALRIHDPAARGFGMGLASHGIATARAFQESETAGTFSGLAMALNAVATSILAPLLVRLLLLR
jgi:predicted murein hydrolase (TIGR00659 family)